MHNIIFTKEGPRAAKDVELPLNSTHKSWQTARYHLQSFAPSYQEENKGWIVSLLDGVGGVTKAVALSLCMANLTMSLPLRKIKISGKHVLPQSMTSSQKRMLRFLFFLLYFVD